MARSLRSCDADSFEPQASGRTLDVLMNSLVHRSAGPSPRPSPAGRGGQGWLTRRVKLPAAPPQPEMRIQYVVFGLTVANMTIPMFSIIPGHPSSLQPPGTWLPPALGQLSYM